MVNRFFVKVAGVLALQVPFDTGLVPLLRQPIDVRLGNGRPQESVHVLFTGQHGAMVGAHFFGSCELVQVLGVPGLPVTRVVRVVGNGRAGGGWWGDGLALRGRSSHLR